jgi:hypothetical protein
LAAPIAAASSIAPQLFYVFMFFQAAACVRIAGRSSISTAAEAGDVELVFYHLTANAAAVSMKDDHGMYLPPML